MLKMALIAGNPDLAMYSIPFGCGQCLPCRINKRRIWLHRLLLEAVNYDPSNITFLTLTYSDEFLPADGSLSRRPLQLFFKSLRKHIQPLKIRYYSVGEYGQQSGRPHYHAIIYGLPPEFDYQRFWHLGFTFSGTFTKDSAQYVAGYVVKKFIKKSDLRKREFTAMSLRPAIGLEGALQLKKYENHPIFKRALEGSGDVPPGLRHGNKFLPFGRYIKDKLRDLFNVTGDLNEYTRELQIKYLKDPKNYEQNLLKEDAQRVVQMATRFKIFNSFGDI
jgi:hypothetical protein